MNQASGDVMNTELRRRLPAQVKRLLPYTNLRDSYLAARRALSVAAKLEDVKSIADQATALAVLAKEMDDDTLFDLATRVKDRAYDELGTRLDTYVTINSVKNQALTPDQRGVAQSIGLAPHKATNALLISRMDPAVKEERIEGPKPPSVTKLAAEARRLMPKPTAPIECSRSFETIVRGNGGLVSMVNFMKRHSPASKFGSQLSKLEAQWVSDSVITPMNDWIDEFQQSLRLKK